MFQYGKPLWSRLILQLTWVNATGTARELFTQLHHSSRWSFRGSFILQLGSGLLAGISILHFPSVGVGFEILCKEACMRAIVLSTQAFQQNLFYCHSLQSPLSQKREIQSLNVLLWVEYLRWKFKLFSTVFWSGRSISVAVHLLVLDISIAQFYFSRIRFFFLSLLLLNAVHGSFLLLEAVVQRILLNKLIYLLEIYECDSAKYPHGCYKYLLQKKIRDVPNVAQDFYGEWLEVNARIYEQGKTPQFFLMGRFPQFAVTNGSAPISFIMKFSVSIFLILPTCVVMMYPEVFEQLKVHFRLTTKCLTIGKFWA